MSLYKLLGSTCCFCLLVLAASCRDKATMPVYECGGIPVSDSLYHLDINKARMFQRIEPEMTEMKAYKFLQVEVVKVINPKNFPVTLRLYYNEKNNSNLFLGSFSLYPSDNPGKFIVATHMKLKNTGNVILMLVLPENLNEKDSFSITTRKIAFLKG